MISSPPTNIFWHDIVFNWISFKKMNPFDAQVGFMLPWIVMLSQFKVDEVKEDNVDVFASVDIIFSVSAVALPRMSPCLPALTHSLRYKALKLVTSVRLLLSFPTKMLI